MTKINLVELAWFGENVVNDDGVNHQKIRLYF